MVEKILAFKVVEDMGAQYINTDGDTINVPDGAIVTNADPDTMYVEAMVDGKKKKTLKYGWEVIKNYLPPATPLDVKLAEAEEVKRLSAENVALKKQLDKNDDT